MLICDMRCVWDISHLLCINWSYLYDIPSGKLLHTMERSTMLFMGKLTISMASFNSMSQSTTGQMTVKWSPFQCFILMVLQNVISTYIPISSWKLFKLHIQISADSTVTSPDKFSQVTKKKTWPSIHLQWCT